MIPIHELLNRIQWDPEFARGNFELGYYDRTEDRIILAIEYPASSIQHPVNWHLAATLPAHWR